MEFADFELGVNRCYDGFDCCTDFTPVTATSGQVTTNIDFELCSSIDLDGIGDICDPALCSAPVSS